ncbi:hypothetical protein QM797_25470 [Rhodococcus sp. IEGM 1381]|uniref:hypothetical protein n=1 Tax=Rhodococcus sp. IEGM 1381 TaxID=3047085 RepID=UPI0024B85FFD|nr:hypothetical protein [Rhodococcus sp. IEGM 1381]MDI9898086.1 hypothetical protein [Rhodococcus sp. IEGM 1381]
MWEVLIGAVAALAGGFGGAILQARSSRRLLEVQHKEDEKVRRETYDRETATRFLDVRREAYASLMSNWSNLDYARREADAAIAESAALPEPDPSDGAALRNAVEVRTEAARAAGEAQRYSEAVISAMETVMLLAPPEVRDAMPPSTGSNVEAKRQRFFKAARADLGIRDLQEPI